MVNIYLFSFFVFFVSAYECNCINNAPVITNDFNVQLGSLCPGCVYNYTHPQGYDFVDIEYAYTSPIYINIYQDNAIVNSYNGSLCFQRLYIDRNHNVLISMYTLSTNVVWANIQHENTFSNLNGSYNPYHAPQINTVFESTSIFNYSYTYNYTFPYANTLFINIQLNNTVLIIIYCDSNIIFDNTTNLLRINLVSPTICNIMTFSIVPTNNINTNTNKFIILPLSSYQIDGYYQSDNTNTRAIAIASIVIICITTLVLSFFVAKFITNKQYQSFH